METGDTSTIATRPGKKVYAVDIIRDSEQVFTYIMEGGSLSFERCDSSGQILASTQRKAGGGKHGWISVPIVHPKHGVLICTKTCVLTWPFTGDWEPVAGRLSEAGTRDGNGHRALFNTLRTPMNCQASSFLLAREAPMGSDEPSRLFCLDLRTDDVCTIDVQGLDMATFEHAQIGGRGGAVSGNRVFVWKKSLAAEGQVELFHGELAIVESGRAFAGDIRGMDLTESFEPLVFRVATGETLYMDGRILAARSVYFQRMLASNCREAFGKEIDLRSDPSVGFLELSDLLRYIISDVFEPASDSVEHMFCVRTLADRYQVLHLRAQAETRLAKKLAPKNVLSFLGRVIGSGGILEHDCWKLLEERGHDILQDSAAILVTLAAENPELARTLLLRSSEFGGLSKRRRLS